MRSILVLFLLVSCVSILRLWLERSPPPPPRQRGSIFEQNLSAASAASASASASATPSPSPSPSPPPSPSASGFWIGTGSSVASFLASVPVVLIAYDYPRRPPASAGLAPGCFVLLCSASLGFLNFLATTEKWIFTMAEWSAFCRWSATFTALAYGISAAQLAITRKSLPKFVRGIATPILYIIACVVPSIFGRAFRHDPHGWAYNALAVSYGIFWGLPFLMRSFASWARWYVGVWGEGAELGFTTEPRFMVSSMLNTIAALLWVFYSDTVEHHDGHFWISIVASIGGACVFLGQLVTLLEGKKC
ncbi:hypothetical protein SELMODRAFT_416549 [Selaginella moellendorffii]|uniref:Uncharacterized protein n=1 Tax=Selaginella moellendorffii TaxID=88036 RepID=D8RZM8_SELML|nr:hypothetical protein SELMODRAFT_416549 [Selaginella moellendorffii]